MQSFREVQRFRQWWVWLLLLCANGLPLTLLMLRFQELLKGSGETVEYIVLSLGCLVVMVVTVLMLLTRLDTVIDRERISVRLYPFHLDYRTFKRKEVTACELRKYRPIAEYGGWGLRGTANNKAYSISGDHGIQLTFTNGNRLLIGTSMPQTAKEALLSLGWM